jgi:rfaE bifunctional protein nucleotidyltransferase chain/domain
MAGEPDELASFARSSSLVPHFSKLVSLAELLPELEARRARGERIAFTNGAFDLLHVGHVRSLEAARRCGDALVVGLNSDSSVKSNKVAGRPIVPAAERAELLAALACVDYVVVFDEPTAERLVAAIRPEVYVKGGDYTVDTLPESPIVLGYGGRVELVPLEAGRSTSGLVEEIVRRFGPPRLS